MFGYVRPLPDDLKVKEYNTYKALYCGLCKCTGKCVGCAARFALSYDFVFLALVRIACTKERVAFDKGRCMAHPFKKRPYALPCDALEYSSRVSALLTYYKVLDDIDDEKGLKLFARRMIKPFAAHAAKNAGDMDGLGGKIREHLHALSNLEKAGEASADAPAEIFGRLLGDIGAHALTGEGRRIAEEICFHTGKWIYFADALDDLYDDERDGKYNPLIIAYPGKSEDARQNMLSAMAAERKGAILALDLLECDDGARAMLTNILTCGMAAQEKRLSEKKYGKSV